MANKDIMLELIDLFKGFLPVYKDQQKELIAYRLAFAGFKKKAEEFTDFAYYLEELESLLLRAQRDSVLQDSTVVALGMMKTTLDKWFQEVAETVSDSEVSELLKLIKRGLPN